jgi:hypothetical protein
LLPGIAILFSRLQVTDLAGLVRAGQIMLDTHALLRTDVFTFTIPGAPWINQQWGAELLLAGWFRLGGWKGLLLAQAVIISGCFGATYRCARSAGAASLVAAIATLWGFAIAATLPGTLAMRPQLLALPLFVTSAWLIRTRDGSWVRFACLLGVEVVWANIHGSFILVPAMLVIAGVADLWTRRTLASWTFSALAASLAVPLLCPWGPAVYRYVIDVARSPYVAQMISEWRPILTRQPVGALFLMSLVAGIFILWRRGRAPTIEEALTLVLFTGLTLWSGRNLLWWSVAVPPVVGSMLAGWRPGGSWTRTATRLVFVTMVLLAGLGLWRVARTPAPDLLEDAPSGISAWLAENPDPAGRIFAEWWGWWFEYAVPDQRVFVDARVELFPSAIWDDYFTVVDGAGGWDQTLQRWDVRTVVADAAHELPLRQRLEADPCWTLAYQDADGAVYRRTDAGTCP